MKDIKKLIIKKNLGLFSAIFVRGNSKNCSSQIWGKSKKTRRLFSNAN